MEEIDNYAEKFLELKLIKKGDDSNQTLAVEVKWQPPLALIPEKGQGSYSYFQKTFKDTPDSFAKKSSGKEQEDEDDEEDQEKNADRIPNEENLKIQSQLIKEGEELLFIDSYQEREINYYGKLTFDKEKIDTNIFNLISKAFKKGYVEKGENRVGIQGIVRADPQYHGVKFLIQVSKDLRVKPTEIKRSDAIISLHFSTIDDTPHDQNRKKVPKSEGHVTTQISKKSKR